MTIPYLLMDETGVYVIRSGRQTELPEGAISPPNWMKPRNANLWYKPDGEWALRPISPRPGVTSMVDYAVTMADCPIGTVAEIYDVDGGEYMGSVEESSGTITIELPDPGTYRIEVSAPLPYLPTSTLIFSETAS